MSSGTVEGLKSANELTKQIITLATGTIALTVTFLKDIAPAPTAGVARVIPCTLQLGWVCFAASIVLALWASMAITGTLNAIDRQSKGLALKDRDRIAAERMTDGWNIRIPAILMLLAFLGGVVLTIRTGWSAR